MTSPTRAPDAQVFEPGGPPLLGQWAVVTGASKGIGRGIAGALHAAGANVVLVARGADPLDEAKRTLDAEAVHAQTTKVAVADTADPVSVEQLFARLASDLPQLNIVIANAGSGHLTPFLDLRLDDWQRSVALNLTGTFLCCQHGARLMVEAPGTNRSIVVISSIRAVGARPGLAAYATTKAGIDQLARIAAYELAPEGIRVNVVAPGITATPLALEENAALFGERIRDVPLGRAGTPADVAGAVSYLCHPAAAFVTGTTLTVDGGESLW
jgi:3-oxoacyl-[acyl-carrier protein] reductase